MTPKTRGSGTFVRFLIIFFNSLFVLGGLALLVVSVWAWADEKTLRPYVKTRVFSSMALMGVAVAVIAVIAALLGCYGASKRIRWMVIIFASLLLLFLLITLGIVIALYVFRTVLGKQIQTALVSSMMNDYQEEPPSHTLWALKDSWDWLQQTLRCCGVASNGSAAFYTWQTSRWFRLQRQSMLEEDVRKNVSSSDLNLDFGYVPTSCCVPASPDIVIDPTDNSTFLNRDKCLAINSYVDFRGPPRIRITNGVVDDNDALYVEGCFHSFRAFLGNERNLVIVVSSVVALIAVQVIGLGLACHLCRRLRSREQMDLEDFSNGGRRR